MNLKSIIAISGMNGLYKLITKSKNSVIVENVLTKKKSPAFAVNSISALDEITVYSEGGTTPLKEVLLKIREKENGGKVTADLTDGKQLKNYFGTVVPSYDKEKVYGSDIKKILNWYNILLESGLMDAEEEKGDEAPVAEEKKEEVNESRNA